MPIHSFPEKKVLARASKACLGGRRAADPDPPWTSGSGNLATSSWVPLTGWDWDVPCSQGCIRSVGNRDSLQKKRENPRAGKPCYSPCPLSELRDGKSWAWLGQELGKEQMTEKWPQAATLGGYWEKLGKIPSPKVAQPRQGWNPHPCRDWREYGMWHLGTRWHLGRWWHSELWVAFPIPSIQPHVQQFSAFSALLWMEFFCSHNFFLSSLGTGVRSWWV